MKTIKRPTESQIFAELREMISKKIGEKLDFRTRAYLENTYGLAPTFSYDFAKKVIRATYEAVAEYKEQNKMFFVVAGEHSYNLEMQCEKLRTASLKEKISSLAYEMYANSSNDIVIDWFDNHHNDDLELGNGIVEINFGKESLTVQMCHSYYMPQNNCETYCKVEIDDELMEQFIELAEEFAYNYRQANNVFYFTDFGCASNSRNAYIRKNKVTGEFSIIIKNGAFNAHDYGVLFEAESAKFSSLKEARQYLKNYSNDYHGLNELISDLSEC